jgi:hypothetical protein
MSYKKVTSGVAAIVTAFAMVGVASADTGKSPNGEPGPAGNPNPPAATPQANGPQGPAGNDQRGQSQESHGKSDESHGKSQQSHGKSNQSHGKSGGSHGKSNKSHGKSGSSHRNPSPGTPRKGGREDRPSPKVTLCHATRSETNPYVEITISENGLNGHGPAADPRHHEGSWQDIIPAPAGGCPTTVQSPPTETKQEQNNTTTTTPTTTTDTAAFVLPKLELVATAPAAATGPADQSAVLGVQAEGTTPAAGSAPGNAVLGEQAEGVNAPAAAQATRAADDADGSLPFTGFGLGMVLLIAAALLLAGFAIRRSSATRA